MPWGEGCAFVTARKRAGCVGRRNDIQKPLDTLSFHTAHQRRRMAPCIRHPSVTGGLGTLRVYFSVEGYTSLFCVLIYWFRPCSL